MDVLRLVFVTALSIFTAAEVFSAESPFIVDSAARKVGMRVQWSGIIPVPMASGQPVSLRYLVNQSEMRSLVDLVVDGQTLRTVDLGMIGDASSTPAKLQDGFLTIYSGGGLTLREMHNSAVGDPLGSKPNSQTAMAVKQLVKTIYGDELKSEARFELQRSIDRFKAQFAGLELEMLKLKRRGKEGKLVPVKVPATRLYALGYNGNLVCMDAETGHVFWSVHTGDPSIRPLGMDADDASVVVIAGPRMFVFDAHDGKEIATTWLEGAPRYGPLLGGNHAFIWTTGGGVEGYALDHLLDAPFRDVATGGLESDPGRSPQGTRMGWPTSLGFLYILETAGNPSIPFRLQPPDPVTTSIAAAPKDRILTVSQTGTVYCVDAASAGRVAWRKLIGQTIYDPPVAVNNLALVLSLERELFALKMENGLLAWEAPIRGISKVLGGDGDNQVYALSVLKELLIIDSKRGTINSRIRLSGDATGITQNMTDRLFIQGSQGEIQCLRPLSSLRPKPIYRIADLATPAPVEDSSLPTSPKLEPSSVNSNPFGAATAPAMEAEPASTPFSFDAPAADAPANPFGDSPFGTN